MVDVLRLQCSQIAILQAQLADQCARQARLGSVGIFGFHEAYVHATQTFAVDVYVDVVNAGVQGIAVRKTRQLRAA